jgi:UDP-N-acetylglucosamine acyltransferase
MNQIHHTAVIGDDVQIGEGNVIGPFAVIIGPCSIGDDNWIGPNVVIGTPVAIRGLPHVAGWENERSAGSVRIGSRNVIREHVGVQRGSEGDGVIGDDCYIMGNVHISHDAQIGDGVMITCGSMLAGHVTIGDRSNLGLGTVVHQRVTIGIGVMAGMGSVVIRDAPDFSLIYGNPAQVRGANRIGLERAGYDPQRIDQIDNRLRGGEN